MVEIKYKIRGWEVFYFCEGGGVKLPLDGDFTSHCKVGVGITLYISHGMYSYTHLKMSHFTGIYVSSNNKVQKVVLIQV